MMLELTSVLPIPTSLPQSRLPPNRYATQAARWWFGFSRPAPGVTMPCRSASGSLANATSKRSRISVSRAIAYGDEQSIRILPSQSSDTKRNVGSIASLTISRSSRWRSAIATQ